MNNPMLAPSLDILAISEIKTEIMYAVVLLLRGGEDEREEAVEKLIAAAKEMSDWESGSLKQLQNKKTALAQSLAGYEDGSPKI